MNGAVLAQIQISIRLEPFFLVCSESGVRSKLLALHEDSSTC
jgi:hypothetical protein